MATKLARLIHKIAIQL